MIFILQGKFTCMDRTCAGRPWAHTTPEMKSHRCSKLLKLIKSKIGLTLTARGHHVPLCQAILKVSVCVWGKEKHEWRGSLFLDERQNLTNNEQEGIWLYFFYLWKPKMYDKHYVDGKLVKKVLHESKIFALSLSGFARTGRKVQRHRFN